MMTDRDSMMGGGGEGSERGSMMSLGLRDSRLPGGGGGRGGEFESGDLSGVEEEGTEADISRRTSFATSAGGDEEEEEDEEVAIVSAARSVPLARSTSVKRKIEGSPSPQSVVKEEEENPFGKQAEVQVDAPGEDDDLFSMHAALEKSLGGSE